MNKNILSFLKENLEKNSCDIQKEVPIKSAKSFLYEYWNVFFYLYSKKLLEKFKNNISEKFEPNILDSLSINNIFTNETDNSQQIKETENNKDYINLNNNMSINNPNNINLSSQNNVKSSLLQPQNNNIGIGNNYIYPNFTGMIPNTQNDLFINQIPRIHGIPNNLNVNSFYTGPKVVQNTFGNDIRPNLFGDMENINNIERSNVPFFQIPIQNQIPLNSLPNSLVSSNNVISTNIPNNFLLANNNTNISTNSNININKNINNIINVENKNINNSNTISNSNFKNEIIDKITSIDDNLKHENNKNKKFNSINNNTFNSKIKFTSKTYDNNSNKNMSQSKNLTDCGSKSTSNLIQKISTPLFNIKESTLIKGKDKKDKLISKKRKRFIKNNKLVFIQLDKEKEKNEEKSESIDNKNDSSLNSEKVDGLIKNIKPRGSRYRGVSKNGSQWQVLIMIKKKKRYLGSFSNEEEAARAYDRVALQHHGIKAKTNYDYTKEEVEQIMSEPKLLKLE